jgi:hypothetical protein
MLRDEKIRVVERQWIVPLPAFSARCIPISCGLFSDPKRLAKSGHYTHNRVNECNGDFSTVTLEAPPPLVFLLPTVSRELSNRGGGWLVGISVASESLHNELIDARPE